MTLFDFRYFDSHTHCTVAEMNVGGILDYSYDWLQSNVPEKDAFFSISFHPQAIVGYASVDCFKAVVNEYLNDPRFIAIGEVGLHNDSTQSMEMQEEVLQELIRFSNRLYRPMILHCVGAFDRLLYLRKRCPIEVPYMIHGYRKNEQLMRQLLDDEKCYLSLSIYAPEQVVQYCPPDRILLETDGKANIEAVYMRTAALRQLSIAELQCQIRNNILNFLISDL